MAMVSNLLTALGEEIGWRGFLAPTFYRARGLAWGGVATKICDFVAPVTPYAGCSGAVGA